MLRSLVFLLLFGAAALAEEAAPILLWPQGAPGSEGRTAPDVVTPNSSGERIVTGVNQPSITPFLPAPGKETGAAVLVIPGGGHRLLCVDHEGANPAKFLAEHGVAAFVLRHRLAREEGSPYTIEGHAVPDARRAMRLIRSHAAEWKIDPARLGAMGFSAGGELVWQICRPEETPGAAADPIDQLPARPAFEALIYPGRSADIQPEKDYPPAFLACGEKDRQDISEGLPEVYLRFKRAGVSAELHVYAGVGHGFGLRPTMTGPVAGWADRFLEWMTAKR